MTPAAFSADDYAGRMSRAAHACSDAGLSGLVITPGPDLVYLTGYQPVAITERLTALILAPGRQPAMIMPRLERPDVERSPAAGRLRLSDWADGSDPYAALAPLFPDPRGKYGISDSSWSLHLLGMQEALPDSGYTSLTKALPMMRAVKDAAELGRLAAAGKAADEAYFDILEVAFAGRLETEVAADLADALRRHGHSQVDFTVVGSGPNGANPHHEAGDRRIERGDTIVLDFGGLMDGYGSDTTRTVHVGDDVPEEVRKVHQIVRAAQQTAFEAVRPGVPCQEIDRAARRVITEAGYGDYFIHRTGHGIGTTTHEPPYMVEGETRTLVPGMCFSIEPGVYLPGRFGVRIEDIVTVTETGGRRLNETPHDLAIVQ